RKTPRREIIRCSIPLPSSSTSIWRRRAEARVVELLPFAVEFLVGETVLAVGRSLLWLLLAVVSLLRQTGPPGELSEMIYMLDLSSIPYVYLIKAQSMCTF
ncbi:unnamed protein product, partial [Musa acuminata subsp. burmannicoides]